MINLRTDRAKKQYLFYVDRQMNSLERGFIKSLRTVLNKQWKAVATFVEMGNYDIDHVLNITYSFLAEIFRNHYKRVYFLFGDIIFNTLDEQGKSFIVYEQKTFKESYLDIMRMWAADHMAEQIVNISLTTKKQIAAVIETSMLEGLSNREIAKEIIKKSEAINLKRAIRIARTETHTVAMKSTNEAMKSTGLKFVKEWVSAMDSRTRVPGKNSIFNHVAANGETVGKEEYYEKTGGSLFYPGDSAGAAGNIINCRCVEIYHTV